MMSTTSSEKSDVKKTKRLFACPFSCLWKGTALQLIDHFSEIHKDLLNEDGEFKLPLRIDQNTKGIVMTLTDTTAFIIFFVYNTNGNLQYDIRYCSTDETLCAFSKIKLISNSDTDNYIGLTKNKCVNYDNTFYNTDKLIELNLSNYLQNLNNPTHVTVAISLLAAKTGGNNNFDTSLDSLTCQKCFGYLVPPVYDLESTIICSYCSKKYPNSTWLYNPELLKLVNETDFPCLWQECEFKGKINDFKEHYVTCEFRKYECLISKSENRKCKSTYTIEKIINHLKNSHSIKYLPEVIVYTTTFDHNKYGDDFGFEYEYVKHEHDYIFTVKDNEIILVKYKNKQTPYSHVVSLISSGLRLITGRVKFEHKHCRKSKVFNIDNQNVLKVVLSKLPPCFTVYEELTVTVHVDV